MVDLKSFGSTVQSDGERGQEVKKCVQAGRNGRKEDAKRKFMDGVNEDMDVVGVSEEDGGR